MSNDMYAFKLYHFTNAYSGQDCREHPYPDRNSIQFTKLYCTDSNLYLCASPFLLGSRTSCPEVWRYNFMKSNWSLAHRFENPQSEEEEMGLSSTVWKEVLFIRIAGPASSRPESTHQSLRFTNLRECKGEMGFVHMDPRTSLETSAAEICSPTQYEGYSMVVHEDHLYLVGGTDSVGESMDVYEFNMEAGKWVHLYDSRAVNDGELVPRVGHGAVYYEHRIYVFGGLGTCGPLSARKIPVFDVNTRTWTVKTTGAADERFPTKKGKHAIAQHPHRPSIVFLCGGCYKRADSSVPPFNDTWQIDLDTMQWKVVPSLGRLQERCTNLMSATPDGRVYVMGGSSHFTMNSKKLLVAWFTIPKLADLCWDALMFYVRKNIINLPDDVSILGLPEKYRKRLL